MVSHCLAAGRYEAQMEHFAFQNALEEIFKVIQRANKYIDENSPWALAKDEANGPAWPTCCTTCWRPSASAPSC